MINKQNGETEEIMKKTVIVGAGGHAKVIADILLQNGEYEIVGLIDKNAKEGFWGIPVLGNDDLLYELYRTEKVRYAFVALGDGKVREKISQQILDAGYQLINAISRHAVLSPTCKVGQGVAVMPGAVINAEAEIGNGCIVNTNASVDHEVKVGEYSHIAPGCAISGCVRIGRQCLIGTGSRIIDKVRIGDYVTVGAGAAVIRDYMEAGTVVGIPARKIK